ncbi:hypothetical protein [Halobacteriovorax sp. HLS]|uniref:hypothetical protein n=1 Tax=Halobacteriovorax sp. HLS TaxID=2234000 RepID=UPI000FDCB5F9|nr:hypothetical protein [Halobacteriovorax sp. HLS]
MKSNKTKIIFIVLFSVITIIFGGVYFYAKSQVSPEKVHRHTLNLLNKTFPRAKVNLGKAELTFGLSIKVNFETLQIEDAGQELVSLKNLDLVIPLLSILTGGGDLKINLKSPSLNYRESKKSNNWSDALLKETSTKREKKSVKKNGESQKNEALSAQKTLALPAFLLNSTLSLDIRDIKVNYLLKDKSSGNIKVEKVILKKIGLRNSSGYEIQSLIEYTMKNNEKLKLDALLIGQFDFSHFLKSGTLETVSELNLKNISIPGIKGTIPEIKTHIATNIGKLGKISIDWKSSFLQSNHIALKAELDSGRVELSSISSKLALKDLFSIFALKVDGLTVGNGQVELSGKINISKKGHINPKLDFSIGPNLKFVKKNFSAETAFSGSLRGNEFKSMAEFKLLDGVVTLQNTAKLDLNNPPTMNSLPKVITLLSVNNLTIKEGLIQDLLYSVDTTSTSSQEFTSNGADKEVSKDQEQSVSAVPIIPPGEVTVKLNNIKIDSKNFNLNSKLYLSKNKIALDKSLFSFSKGKGEVSATIDFNKASAPKGIFNFDLKNFDLIALKPFLPKDILKALSGEFTGKTSGSFSIKPGAVEYDVLAKLNATNGEVQGVNISEYLTPIVLKVPKVGPKYADKIKNIDGKFQLLNVDGRFRQNNYELKNFKFIGISKKIELSGSGNVSPSPKRASQILMNYTDPTGKISSELKKEIGIDYLPLRLAGTGFSLKPDINYTLNKISKTAIKTQGKKEIDKFLQKDSTKKKINKLFKGLFK